MYSRYAFALRLKTRYSYITLDFFSSCLFNFSESVMQADVLLLSVQSCLGEIKGTISFSFFVVATVTHEPYGKPANSHHSSACSLCDRIPCPVPVNK